MICGWFSLQWKLGKDQAVSRRRRHLHPCTGRCTCIHVQAQDLHAGQILILAPGIKRDVEAHTASAFLPTIRGPAAEIYNPCRTEDTAPDLVVRDNETNLHRRTAGNSRPIQTSVLCLPSGLKTCKRLPRSRKSCGRCLQRASRLRGTYGDSG